MKSDYCRCPGCGTCDSANKLADAEEELRQLRTQVAALKAGKRQTELIKRLPLPDDVERKLEHYARLQERIARVLEQAEWLFEHGHLDDLHEGDCPEDDTCECEAAIRVNLMFAELEGRESAAEESRAALAKLDEEVADGEP